VLFRSQIFTNFVLVVRMDWHCGFLIHIMELSRWKFYILIDNRHLLDR